MTHTMRRLGVLSATAMIVTEVVGVGMFLTPATLARTLGTPGRVIAIWILMGALTVAGALCYAELSTRFPKAGGGYVFLREAFGARCAFVYGWMALLVMDPGITAALGIGFAQYLLAALGAPASLTPIVAIAAILAFGLLTLLGLDASTRLLRWTAAAKLAVVALLTIAGLAFALGDSSSLAGAAGAGAATATAATQAAAFVPPALDPGALAAAIIAAFFAFGGWWDLGKMSEEVADPRRTLPRALVTGVSLVAIIYTLASLTFVLVAPAARAAAGAAGGGAGAASAAVTDEVLVSNVGAALFGPAAGQLLAAIVVIAVSGSLAAMLLGAPRVYVAMARDGLFPARLARFDTRRQSAPGATLVQVALACVLTLLGTFDQILGYFVPSAVFFLGLSACALFVLPRPAPDAPVFRAPAHPWTLLLFLLLIAAILLLFLMGRPVQTLLGAAIVAAGVPVSWIILRAPRGTPARATVEGR